MILVFGGTGFIGKALLARLHALGRAAMTVSRQPDQAFMAAHAPSAEALTLEAFHADPASALFDCRAVVYLASSSTPGSNLDTPWRETQDNLAPLLRALHAICNHGAPPVVFLSSGGTVYGRHDAALLSEDTPLRPVSPYGMGKTQMETALRFMADSRGLPATILRPSNPIGQWQTSRSQGVVGALLRAARSGTPFPMIGDGRAVRDYFDVRDLVAAILLAVDRPESARGQTWNVGSGQGHSVLDIHAMVERATGCTIRCEPLPARTTDVERVVLDTARIRAATGWQARIPLHAALRDLVAAGGPAR